MSFKKYSTAENRTLWQIFWKHEDSENEAELTMVDASAASRARSRLERDVHENQEDSDEDVVYESQGEQYPPPRTKRQYLKIYL